MGYRSELLKKKVIGILDYWYGKGVGEKIIQEENWEVEFSPTGKIRRLYIDNELAFTFRPKDFYPVPYIKGAILLHKVLPFLKRRVVVNEEQEKFVLQKKSVLNKFVIDVDPELYAGDYVLIVNKNDELLAIGQLILPPEIIKEINTGFAAETKKVIKK